jgi:uncharacterized protein YehS (DUF1456 family)
MTNNEIFNKLLHLTGCSRFPEITIEIFKLGGINASKSLIKGWRTTKNYRATRMPDQVLNGFFSGLFEYRDKKKSEGIDLFYTQIKG